MTHPESRWTHAICDPCWESKQPARVPSRLIEREVETCCFCGRQTESGIYYRADPTGMRCEGVSRRIR